MSQGQRMTEADRSEVYKVCKLYIALRKKRLIQEVSWSGMVRVCLSTHRHYYSYHNKTGTRIWYESYEYVMKTTPSSDSVPSQAIGGFLGYMLSHPHHIVPGHGIVR